MKLQLLHQKTSKEYFKWPLSQHDAEDMLLIAYKKEVEGRCMQFVDNDRTHQNISKVAEHLVNPKKFGLMLAGTCGNGKTTLMLAIQRATNVLSDMGCFNKEVLVKHYNDLVGYYDRIEIEEYKVRIRIVDVKEIIAKCKDFSEMEALKKTPYLGIDDLGKEPTEVMDYGNICNPVIDLLEYRYNRQLTTFITTNLTPDELKTKYGERISDRLREMIEKIVFEDGSYRR